MDAITLPQEKIYGERFGQLIYNAVRFHFDIHKDADIADKIFNIENTDLELAIDAYINELKEMEENDNAKN